MFFHIINKRTARATNLLIIETACKRYPRESTDLFGFRFRGNYLELKPSKDVTGNGRTFDNEPTE
ncbi:hypothetical protein [Flagellimonas flava]|uniref:hypothetical protein n=1 Tax=Flagellimonas flava TaxID=570519 RepID=UPI003D65FED6